MDLSELYQDLIIDHGTEPRNFYCMQDCTDQAEGYNPFCGDKVHVYLKLDNNIIKEISFSGEGCAISMASASIMTEMLQNKAIGEAIDIFNDFHDLVMDKIKDNHEMSSEKIGKLQALAGVKQFPARVKCATLSWHAMIKAAKKN